ncbi:inx [Mytilus edulis]|uniref:Innexin n=1 Tax=Mytilus edulis TaxID=6550 RepID=A0A8S3T0H5_MYTED|nr:inx [Mytilus edulis]
MQNAHTFHQRRNAVKVKCSCVLDKQREHKTVQFSLAIFTFSIYMGRAVARRHEQTLQGINDFELARKLAGIKDLTDDSRIHQLNRSGCLIFFIAVAIAVSTKLYVGNPIQCWCPAQFTKYQRAYIDSYCWVRNTYVIDFNSTIPNDKYLRHETEIPYYQWTPIILLFQAVLFYVPRLFWKGFSGYSSLNIKKIIKNSNEISYKYGKERKESLKGTVEYFEKYLKIRNRVTTRHRNMEQTNETIAAMGIHKGNYIVLIFLLTSFLYAATALCQIFIVDSLLGIRFKTLGPDILKRATNGDTLLDPNRFPIVTFCDFELRQMTNVQTWTVQCSLPINLFSEKIFIANWFLLVIMTIINAIYFLYNLVSTFLPYRAEVYVQKFLTVDGVRTGMYQKIPEHLTESQKDFVHSYLRRDGVFLIWMLSNKVNQVVAGEIVNELWMNYTK